MSSLGHIKVGQEVSKSQFYLLASTSEVCIPGAQLRESPRWMSSVMIFPISQASS